MLSKVASDRSLNPGYKDGVSVPEITIFEPLRDDGLCPRFYADGVRLLFWLSNQLASLANGG